MYVPPLHPSNNFDSYVSGEVIIHPTAVVAPGVLLQASPNGRIIIGAGVCIGMGTILHAYEGTLEVEAGVNLGAGVLVVGEAKIGTNACVGSMSTILNYSIEPKQVVAPGSLITGEGLQVAAAKNEDSAQTTDTNSAPASEPPAEDAGPKVYGQAQLNRVLSSMLPHRQSLSRPLSDSKTPYH